MFEMWSPTDRIHSGTVNTIIIAFRGPEGSRRAALRSCAKVAPTNCPWSCRSRVPGGLGNEPRSRGTAGELRHILVERQGSELQSLGHREVGVERLDQILHAESELDRQRRCLDDFTGAIS